MLKFHLDENVAPAVVVGLRSHGVDVTTTQEAGLLGSTDAAQLEFAFSKERVLVTHDDDFLMLVRTQEHPGVWLLPPGEIRSWGTAAHAVTATTHFFGTTYVFLVR